MVTDFAGNFAPLPRRTPARGQTVGAVRVVLRSTSGVVDVERRALPVDSWGAGAVERRRWRSEGNRCIGRHRCCRDAASADHLDDVDEFRVGTNPVDRRVEVVPAQQTGAAACARRRRPARIRGEIVSSTPRLARVFRTIAAPAVSRYWLVGGHVADVARIGKRRVRDVQLLLANPVDPERLLVDVRIEPVVEHARRFRAAWSCRS